MPDTTRIVHDAIGLFKRGQPDAARQMVQQALTRDPKHPGANQFLAVLLAGRREYERAKYHVGRAIEGDPSFPDFHFTLATILSCTPDLDGAIAALERTLALNPAHVDAMIALGAMWGDRRGSERAEAILREALRLAPNRPDAAAALAKVLADQGRAAEGVALLRDTDRAHPVGGGIAGLLSTLCLMTNYVSDDPAEVLALHQRFGRAARPDAYYDPPAPPRAPKSPLRVAYLSPDFRRHAVASFVVGLIERHDRARVVPFVYHTGGPVDAITRRAQAAAPGGFRHLYQEPDAAIARAVRDDAVDILVDLSGHSAQHRLLGLARRLAPVQVTYVGYPATTGLSTIDARLVDSLTDPPDAPPSAVERLVRLRGCFLAFEPLDAMPEPTAPAAGTITFGSFNNPAKLSDATVDLWSRALAAVPGSRLLLKGRWLGEPGPAARMRERFAARGVAPDRVECLSETRDPREHLALYGRVDVALDPTPYNGTTTTCEALWMGVPVVSLVGRLHAGRVGLSLLTAAGVPEWAAPTAERFAEIAADLARDRARLADLRRSLRARVASSRLGDVAAMARDVEDALERVWRGDP
ncbi:MAG: tetratricopeptide repeat protein [Phycisphaerae bacterium]|nr:tetratricopeptide repeat protein [Phycisphaerae bacterium]